MPKLLDKGQNKVHIYSTYPIIKSTNNGKLTLHFE